LPVAPEIAFARLRRAFVAQAVFRRIIIALLLLGRNRILPHQPTMTADHGDKRAQIAPDPADDHAIVRAAEIAGMRVARAVQFRVPDRLGLGAARFGSLGD